MGAPDPEPPFYVGYLRLPRRLRLPLAVILLVLVIFDVGFALTLVRGQWPPPGGAWGTKGEVTFDGVFEARPYPLLRVADPAGVRTVLLVSADKHGAPGGLDPLDGKHVTISGYPLRRADLTVLQLDRPPEAEPGPAAALPPDTAPTHATLTGEIVDAKCWTGAMVPGDGKGHKGCGSLCLLGGIPALFIAQMPDETARWYLLSAPDGGPVGDETRAIVGERVSLSGTVTSGPGLSRLRLDAMPATTTP